MFKRILIYSLIAAAIAAVLFFYFKLTKGDGGYTNPLSAVPANAALVVEINTVKQDADEMNLLLELSLNENTLGDVSFNPLMHWPAVIQELMKLKTYQPQWQGALSSGAIIFSANDQLRADAWLMSVGLKTESSQGIADDMMYSWLTKEKFTARDFKGRSIMQGVEWNYCLLNNCLVVSPSMAMMEDAVIQEQKNDVLLRNENFQAAHDVMSSDASFHVFSKMDGGTWLQLDPVARNGQWMLSGYAAVSDSLSHTFQLCGDGKPFEIAKYLPSNTAVLDVFSYTDFETGWKKQEDFYANTTASKYWSQAWTDLGDSCKCDLNEALLSWRTGEFGSAVIATSDSTTAEVLFFGVKDTIKVLERMGALVKPIVYPRLRSIQQLRYPQLFERNKPQTFLVETNYIVQLFNYVLAAATPDELNDAARVLQSLDSTETFRQASKNSNTAAGRFIYQSDFYTSPLPAGTLSFLKGLDFISITSEPFKDGKYLVNITLPFESETERTTPTETTEQTIDTPTESDAEILHGPWTVINHNTKSKETLFQNKSNELCLKESDGKLLWSKKLDDEIVGAVTQIDALKNGKLQYAFAAGNHLYVVDRNGKDLMSFPVLLSSNASSPLAVFDYDNTKAYRMIVATENGTLHNHNAQGKMNEGWKYNGTVPIALVKHIKANGEDILVAISHSGAIQVLKRNGEERMDTASTLTDWNKGDVMLSLAGNSLVLAYTNNTGKAAKVEIGLK